VVLASSARALLHGVNLVNLYASISESWDNSVCIEADYGLDGRGSIPGKGKGSSLYSTASTPDMGPTQPPIKWVPETLSRG
jgi:hypothetical protein